MEKQPCIKCKHYEKEGGLLSAVKHLCVKYKRIRNDDVTGEPIVLGVQRCQDARDYHRMMHIVAFASNKQHIGTRFEQSDCFEAK